MGDRGAAPALARAPGARREARDIRADRAGRRHGRREPRSPPRAGDGGYVLNGQKIWISLADIADHFLVFAIDRSREGWRGGITAFLLERGMKGLTTGTLHGKLGIRAGNTGLLTFEDCPCPTSTASARRARGSSSR